MVLVRKRKSNLKRGLLFCAALVIIAASVFGWLKLRDSTNSPARDSQDPSINLEPATEEEKQESEAIKDELGNNENSQSTEQTSDGRMSVKPVITYAEITSAGYLEVGSYINGVSEDGGSCKLKISNAGSEVTRELNGITNVSNTSCPVFSIPRSELRSGNWNLTIEYSSATASGSSDVRVIEVK